jgi:hypothetical protein
VCTNGNITANEANNYNFSSTMTLTPVTVKSKTDLNFDWSGLTVSMLKQDMDPAKGLDNILVFIWTLDLKTFETKMNADTLTQADPLFVPPPSFKLDHSTTSAKLLDFEINSQPICKTSTCAGSLPTSDKVLAYFDPALYPQDKYFYTLMGATGDVLGYGTKMIQAFQVDDNATDTTVKLTNDSAKLDFTADLKSLTPTYIPAGKTGITIDWSKMAKNALGADFAPGQITSAFIANYSESPEELSGPKFLDLETIAKALYRTDINVGSKISFSAFQDSSGKAFPGIDSNGTWLVGLQCGLCHNPAPWYITVLKTCN